MAENRFLKILKEAEDKKIAAGAVNIFNYLTADAVVGAAEELGVNVILQTSSGTVEHFGVDKLFDMIEAVRRSSNIIVSLHLDHCRSIELGKACVDAGWDSVMMDFSHLSLKENIANTKQVADYAHAKGVAIEGEIGIISGVEEEIVTAEEVKAGYDETVKFIKDSGVDAVAPAIGTAHGIYHGIPKLDFDLVEKLGKDDTPIVIHGGSGLSAETFIRLIELGGRKVNISTVVKNTYMDTIKELATFPEKLAPISFDAKVKEAVKTVVKKHLAVFSGLKNEF